MSHTLCNFSAAVGFEEYEMAICEYCNQEELDGVGCTLSVREDLPNGLSANRVRYGEETLEWGAGKGWPCGDCSCPPNSFHHAGCDIDQCSICRGQVATCGCTYDDDELDAPVDPEGHENWVPIDNFFGGCGAPEINAFMFMNTLRNQSGETVWAYKHRDTRRYLFLDEHSNPYRACDGDAGIMTTTSRDTALAMAYDGIDEGLFLSGPGSMPRYEIFPMRRNRPLAA